MADLQMDVDSPPTRNGLHNRIEAERTPSLTDLVSGIMDDTQKLFKQQVQMLRAEIREDVKYGSRAAVYMGSGAVLAIWSLFLFSFAAVYLVQHEAQIQMWAAFAIVAGLFLVGGGIAFLVGGMAFRKYHSLPEKTLNAAQENLSWITKHQN